MIGVPGNLGFSPTGALYVTPDLSGPGQATNALRGSGNTTGTGATTIIPAQGSGVKIYVTGIQAGRTDAGTVPIIFTLNDSASTVVVIPDSGSGGGNNMTFNPPLVVAANTALTFTPGSGVTTAYCNAQGYSGS